MKKIITVLTACWCCLAFVQVSAQITVQGVLTDLENQEPLIGASVQENNNPTNGVVTDIDGRYSITVPEDAELNYSYIGYEAITVPVAGKTSIDIGLSPSVETLNEVIVTSIGIRRDEKVLGFAAEQLDGSTLVGAQETNLVSSLSGKVAGVDIITSSGSPGASANIVIRGRTSFNGSNAPLFVVDGIPIDNSYAGSNFTDQSNRAIDINPNDIAQISVLKGAAATALYGMRAGNGAIIITTKSSQGDGKVRVELSSELSFDQVNKLPQQQRLYAQGVGGAYVDPQGGSPRSWGPLMDTLRYADDPTYDYSEAGRIVGQSNPLASDRAVTPFDNVDNFFQTGVRSNTNLSLSGGNQTANYMLSVGHLEQTGIVPNADFSRSTARLQGSLKPWERLKITGSATYSLSGGNRQQRGSNLSGTMLGLMRTPVSFDLTNGSDDPVNDPLAWERPDGTQRGYNPTYDNPYWSVNRNRVTDRVNRIIGNVGFEWNIIDRLNFRYKIGIDQYSEERKSYWDNNSGEFAAINGLVINDLYQFFALNTDAILTYDFKIGENFDVDLLAGHNFYDERAYNLVQEGENFVIPGFYDVSNAQNQIFFDGLFRERYIGAFYEAKIGFKNYLYLTTTGRNDWSSTLPVATNSFFYPSASLSFVFTEMLGMESNPVLSFGKLRASYGAGGNAAPDPYLLNIVYSAVPNVQGRTGFLRSSLIGNAGLRPEQTSSLELGADMRFFQNRFSFDFTWYRNISEGQILELPIAPSSGFAAQIANGGTIENTGIELLLSARPVETQQFSWDINLNFSRNRNLVVELDESIPFLPIPGAGVTSTRNVIIEGQPFGVIYGTRWLRNENGEILVNDEGYPLVDPENGVVGDPNPDWLMGIRNTIAYKNIQFSFLFDIRQGGDIFNGTKGVMLNLGIHEDTENREEMTLIEGVRASDGAPNEAMIALDESYYSRYPFAGVSEAAIEDGSFVRLRELALTYSVPSSKLPASLSGIRFGLTGRNLLLFTNYSGIDPETNLAGASNSYGRDWFNAPNTRSMGLNLNIQF